MRQGARQAVCDVSSISAHTTHASVEAMSILSARDVPQPVRIFQGTGYENCLERVMVLMLSEGVKRIDHVAVVVQNLDTALHFYRDMLGIAPSRVLDFPQEGVRIAFLPLGGANGS